MKIQLIPGGQSGKQGKGEGAGMGKKVVPMAEENKFLLDEGKGGGDDPQGETDQQPEATSTAGAGGEDSSDGEDANPTDATSAPEEPEEGSGDAESEEASSEQGDNDSSENSGGDSSGGDGSSEPDPPSLLRLFMKYESFLAKCQVNLSFDAYLHWLEAKDKMKDEQLSGKNPFDSPMKSNQPQAEAAVEPAAPAQPAELWKIQLA